MEGVSNFFNSSNISWSVNCDIAVSFVIYSYLLQILSRLVPLGDLVQSLAFLRGQLDLQGSEHLFHILGPVGPNNWRGDLGVVQEPGNGHLGRGSAPFLGQVGQRLDDLL